MLGRLAAAVSFFTIAPCAAVLAQTALPTISAPVPKAPTVAAPAKVEEPRDIVDAIYKIAAADVQKGRVSPFENKVVRGAISRKASTSPSARLRRKRRTTAPS